MQISDLAKQYISTTSSAESMNGTRGVESLVSSVRSLTVGNIFEGRTRQRPPLVEHYY